MRCGLALPRDAAWIAAIAIPSPKRVRGHVPGIGQQRQRSGGDPDDDLHHGERDDQPERDRQRLQVTSTGAQSRGTVVVIMAARVAAVVTAVAVVTVVMFVTLVIVTHGRRGLGHRDRRSSPAPRRRASGLAPIPWAYS